MIYEVLLKLTGGALLSLIHFNPLSFHNVGDTVAIQTILTEPVTKECSDVVNQGLHLGIHYQMLMIINGTQSYKRDTTLTIKKDKIYAVNNAPVEAKNIQSKMGTAVFRFTTLALKESDHIEIFVKANLVADEDFKKSTGFETKVLWKYYVPKMKNSYRFTGGHFTPVVEK